MHMFTFHFNICKLCTLANDLDDFSTMMTVEDCDICGERAGTYQVEFKGEFRSSGRDKLDTLSPWHEKDLGFYRVQYPLDYLTLELLQHRILAENR